MKKLLCALLAFAGCNVSGNGAYLTQNEWDKVLAQLQNDYNLSENAKLSADAYTKSSYIIARVEHPTSKANEILVKHLIIGLQLNDKNQLKSADLRTLTPGTDVPGSGAKYNALGFILNTDTLTVVSSAQKELSDLSTAIEWQKLDTNIWP